MMKEEHLLNANSQNARFFLVLKEKFSNRKKVEKSSSECLGYNVLSVSIK